MNSERWIAAGRCGGVTCSTPEAAAAGLDVIKEGGSAVDAYLAACFVQTVLENGSTTVAGVFSVNFFESGKDSVEWVGGVYGPAAAEDYEMFLRIAVKYEVGVIPEPLLIYVVRRGSISGRKGRIQAISRLRIQFRYFQWTSWMSYYGVLRTALTLLIPRSVKNTLKLKFLYSRLMNGGVSGISG